MLGSSVLLELAKQRKAGNAAAASRHRRDHQCPRPRIVYQMFDGDRVENDDGTWSPKEFTYDPPLPALRRFSATHFGHRFTQLRFSSGINSRVQTEQDRQPFVRAHLRQNVYTP